MKKAEFIIPGACRPKERPRSTYQHGKVIHYTPASTKDYEQKARTIVLSVCNEKGIEPIPYPNPVKMTVEFILNRKATARPDIINLASAIADLLQESKKYSALLYDNDSQLVELHLYKKKGKYPMTSVVVEEL